MTYLICYDICSNTRRARLARLLEKYGERVQLSVFKLQMQNAALEKLKLKMLTCIEEDEDELLVVPLCSNCHAQALRVGAPVELLCVV